MEVDWPICGVLAVDPTSALNLVGKVARIHRLGFWVSSFRLGFCCSGSFAGLFLQ